jgi:hypothetical protein
MIVGGYAVAFHGYPRFTKDMDIFYDLSASNVSKVRMALVEFGFREEEVPEEAFLVSGNIVTFGVEPVRVDLLNRIDGVSFCEARPTIERGQYGSVLASFIGKEKLLCNKRSTMRTRDKADAEELS